MTRKSSDGEQDESKLSVRLINRLSRLVTKTPTPQGETSNSETAVTSNSRIFHVDQPEVKDTGEFKSLGTTTLQIDAKVLETRLSVTGPEDLDDGKSSPDKSFLDPENLTPSEELIKPSRPRRARTARPKSCGDALERKRQSMSSIEDDSSREVKRRSQRFSLQVQEGNLDNSLKL